MKSCDFKTTEASTKAWFRTKGLIDKYLNISDLGKFRTANREMSDLAKEMYNVEGRLFLEEQNGKKAVPNKEMFQRIDRKKGIKYPDNEWVDKQSLFGYNQESIDKKLYTEIKKQINATKPAGIDISKSDGLLWGEFTNPQSIKSENFTRTNQPEYISSDTNSLQSKIDGKTFNEIWSSTEFSSVERRRFLLSSIQERLSDKNSFNGKLFEKINRRLGLLELRVIQQDLGYPLFYFDGHIYVNPETFEKYLTESGIENLDEYLNMTIAEELIHHLTYKLTSQEDMINAVSEVMKINGFPQAVKTKYKSLQEGDFTTLYNEYIRMLVQQEFLGTTTEKVKYTKGGILDRIIQKVWDFLYSIFTNSTIVKELVKRHSDFITKEDSTTYFNKQNPTTNKICIGL